MLSYHHARIPATHHHAAVARPSLRKMGLPSHLQDPSFDYSAESKKQRAANDDHENIGAAKIGAATSLVEENVHAMLDTSVATDGQLQHEAASTDQHYQQDQRSQATALKAHAQTEAEMAVQSFMAEKTFDYAAQAKKVTEPGIGGMASMYDTSASSSSLLPSAGAAAATNGAASSVSSLGAYDKETQIQAAEQWMLNRKKNTAEEEPVAVLPMDRFRATSERLVAVTDPVEGSQTQVAEIEVADRSKFYQAHGAVSMDTTDNTDNTDTTDNTDNTPVTELKQALNVVETEFAAAPVVAAESTTPPPRFVASTETKSIELPMYSNGAPLAKEQIKNIDLPKYDNTRPLRRSVDLPKYDNTQPLRHNSPEAADAVRFKGTVGMKFPDASKLKWHGWVKQRKEKVKKRIQKVLHHTHN